MAFIGGDKGTTLVGAQGDTWEDKIWVKYIRWLNVTTAGHILEIEDNEGGPVGKSVADGQYFIDLIPIFGWVNGINVVDMDSGELYIYFG